jgi:hypothetical protein
MSSTFEQQHTIILGVLWELVVNSNADVKVSAAVLSKALVITSLCLFWIYRMLMQLLELKFLHVPAV